MRVFDSIIYDHNPWIVLLAVLICGTGSWVTARLFLRTTITSGAQRIGWYFFTSLAAGVAIWCTHFVAMLGFYAGVPVHLDPALTMLSLSIAVCGSTAGFILAGSRLNRATPVLGGAVVGLAIAAMHYTGMCAYQMQGGVFWDMDYVVVSVVLSVVLSAAAMHFAMQMSRHSTYAMAGTFALAIAALHFTGMAAMNMPPIHMTMTNGLADIQSFRVLAFACVGMAVVIASAGMVSYLIDDASRNETVKQLRVLALNDGLTGLPNRSNFDQRLDDELLFSGKHGSKVALIGIDLNRFKEINDTRGHQAGDEVLHVLGGRLLAMLRPENGEYIARLGGDEFAAMTRLSDKAGLGEFLERIDAAVRQPIPFEDAELMLGASIGVAIWPDDATDKQRLITHTDLAMYRAKSTFTDAICFYEPGMDELVRDRRSLSYDLRSAITNGELSVFYQPQVCLTDDEVIGYEALLRWDHPQRGFVPPLEFIPIAEENGSILSIGEWVLRDACRTAAHWMPPYKVAVNISATQFSQKDLPDLIARILADSGLPPERLEIELTESAIFADRNRALLALQRIKDIGVTIALDDFGTGYSSLDTLRSFSFDKIKLDRSFIGETTPQTIAFVRAILALGKSLSISVLAEGIETAEQLAMLNVEGCEEAQGFWLGHPVPLDQMVASGQISMLNDAVHYPPAA